MIRFFRWLARRAWVAALIAALALAAGDAASRIRRVEFVSGVAGNLAEAPAGDADSPTGYALGRRTLVLPDTGEDGCQWIMQTQAMLAGGDWRVRRVDYDNAPGGRETHWASPLRWWLAALAWLNHAASGRPLGAAVEWAALRAGPLLLGLLLLAVVPLAARRFGPGAAVVLATGMASAFPFVVCFGADYPDHHGIANACAMLTVLFLLAGGGGLVRTEEPVAGTAGDDFAAAAWLPTPRAARRWFVASAIAGGVGLWVSAATEVPVLVGVGAGALASGWLGRRAVAGRAWRRDPGLWRWWGFAGAAASLAAYLLEYFPAHLGLRLEVNHPLYAFAWLGGGELLCRHFRACGPQPPKFSRRDARATLAAAAAVALVPIVILLTKERTFLVADRFVWALNTQFVAEGKSLLRFLARGLSDPLAAGLALPLLLVAAPLWLLARRGGHRLWKMQAALGLAPALLFLLLTFAEIRWWAPALGLVFAALAPVFAALERENNSRRARRWLAAGCGIALLPGAAALVQAAIQPPQAGPAEIRRLVERDVAHWLRLRAGGDRLVVAATPVVTNHLVYHGSGAGLGTLYWENTEGFSHAAAIFAAPTAAEAHELVRRFGVTHVVLPGWDDFAGNFVRFHRGLPPDGTVPEDTFLHLLLRGRAPAWVRPIPCRLPPAGSLAGQAVLVFEVTAEASPALATARLVDHLLESDATGPAAEAARELDQFPSDLRAQVSLAAFHGQTGRTEAFAATLRRVRELLPQAAAFAVEDRIRLALVLTAGGETDLARTQLREAMARLDERTVRRLTPGGLRDLLKLADVLGVPFPDPRLQQLARGLVPPMLRPPA